jgi:hypothetical protein
MPAAVGPVVARLPTNVRNRAMAFRLFMNILCISGEGYDFLIVDWFSPAVSGHEDPNADFPFIDSHVYDCSVRAVFYY